MTVSGLNKQSYLGQFEKKKRFPIETYFETKFIIALQARFLRHVKCRRYPDKRNLHMCHKKSREHGSALNLNVKEWRDAHSGRPRSARSPVNIIVVRYSIGHSPWRLWSQSRFLLKTFFVLELCTVSWKIHYSNLLCIELSSPTWNIKSFINEYMSGIILRGMRGHPITEKSLKSHLYIVSICKWSK